MAQGSRFLIFAAVAACLSAEPVLAEQARRGPPGWSHQSQPRPMSIATGSCRDLRDRDRRRCEDRIARERREHARRERERRKDAKTEGIVTGVAAAAVGAVLIGALASAGKKGKESKEAKERRRYCLSRYGNYDPATDSYRASDSRSYPCE